MSQPPSSYRFEALDGLRGIAAILVVVTHGPSIGLRPPTGYLLLDLFFIMSGFVLAYTYQKRLLSLRDFGPYLIRRLIRLYPLFAFGLALGLVVYVVNAVIGGYLWPAAAVVTTALNSIFIAAPPAISTNTAFSFPLNPPGWSLAWEMAASIGFGLVAPFLTNRLLILFATVSAVAMGWAAFAHGDLDLGSHWATFPGGGIRVVWGFACGIGIFRLHQAGWLPRPSPWLAMLALAVLIWLPVTPELRPLYATVCALVVLPMLIVLSLGPTTAPFLKYLGRVSFAVYLVHWPFNDVMSLLHLDLPTLVVLVPVILIADVVERGNERVRAWLTARLVKRPTPVAATVASPR